MSPRSKLRIAGGVAAAAAIGVAVWYFALRDTTSACQKLVGPLAELEQLVGVELEMRSGYETEYRCYQYVERRGKAGGGVVNLETSNGSVAPAIQREQGRTFEKMHTFPTALGEATLFVAGGSQHVALLQGKDKVIRIELDRELFSLDKAQTFVTAVAQRAK